MAGMLWPENKVGVEDSRSVEGILWATRPFVRLCVALGLVPFRADTLEGTTRDAGTSSKLHLSYSLAVLAGAAALFCAVAQRHITERQEKPDNGIQTAVELVWALLSGLVAVVSLAVLIAKRGELQEALAEVALIGSKTIPEDTNLFTRARTLLVSEVVTVVCLVIACGGLQVYGIYVDQVPNREYEVVFQLFSFGATLLLSLQFINQLLLLQQLLSIVNEKISKMRDPFPFSLAKGRRSPLDSKEPMALTVRRYAGYHFSLCHLGPRLGNVYGMLALLLSMFDLLDVAFEFYMLINSAITGATKQRIIYQLGVIFILSCPKVITLVLLVASCQAVIEEADQTGVLVSEALLRVKDHQARRESHFLPPEGEISSGEGNASEHQLMNSIRDDKNQLSVNENQLKKKKGWMLNIFLCGLVTNFGACVPVGYMFGVLNTPQAIIKEFCNSSMEYRYGVQMNLSEMNLLWSVIVSAPLITGMFGSLFSGHFADKYGRKWTLFHCLAIQTVAGILLISSRWALSFEMLLVARLLLGFAGGLATGVSPMYLTEIAPFNMRGTMGVLCPMGLSTGVFIAQILGFSFILGNECTWNYLLGLHILLTIPSMAVLIFLPESPTYLYVVKGLQEKGIKELSRLRNLSHKMLLEELVELNLGIPHQINDKRRGFGLLELLQSQSLRLPLLIVVSMQAGQQLSGINAVFYYSMIIFERAGLGKFGSEFASVCAGGVNLAMALVSPWLVGRYTRRGLILLSCYSAATCILMLIIIILLIDYSWWMPYLSIMAVLAFVFCYGLGLGPLPFFIGAELFEIEPRPMAMALGSLANWGGNFLVGVTFPLLQQWLGPWAFATFVLSSLSLAEFLKRKLPETKGLDPIQVSHLFSQ